MITTNSRTILSLKNTEFCTSYQQDPINSSPQPPVMTDLLSVSTDLLFLDILYKQNHTIRFVSGFIHFTVFSRSIHVAAWCSFLIMVDTKWTCRLFIHSVGGHLGSFCFLAITDKGATNICVHVSGGRYVFSSLGYVPRSKITGAFGHSMLHFGEEMQHCFPKWLNCFTFPPEMQAGLSPHRHPSECEMVAHCNLDLHFPSD